MDWLGFVLVAAGWIAAFILGHYLTKREYEYDYRKNTERTYETLEGLKKWQQLEDKKAMKGKWLKAALEVLKPPEEEKKNV